MLENLSKEEIVEKREQRELLLDKRNKKVLEKLKEIVFLGDDEVVTINQVAEYYEVGIEAIKSIIKRHRNELEEDGFRVLKKDNLRDLKGKVQDEPNLGWLVKELKYTRQLTVFPRRAVLRVGMLLNESEIAKTVRDYLLNSEGLNTEKDTEWAIYRKAGKMVRQQLTDAITLSREAKRMGGWAFRHYTDLVYRAVFGESAKGVYKLKGLDKSKDNLRDELTEEELEQVRVLETTVTGLLRTGFVYSDIKDKVNNSFIK